MDFLIVHLIAHELYSNFKYVARWSMHSFLNFLSYHLSHDFTIITNQ